MVNSKSQSTFGLAPFLPNSNWPQSFLPSLPLSFPHGNFKITIAHPHFELTPLFSICPNPSPHSFSPMPISNSQLLPTLSQLIYPFFPPIPTRQDNFLTKVALPSFTRNRPFHSPIHTLSSNDNLPDAILYFQFTLSPLCTLSSISNAPISNLPILPCIHNGNFQINPIAFGLPPLQFPHTPFPTHFPPSQFPHSFPFPITHSSPARHNGNFKITITFGVGPNRPPFPTHFPPSQFPLPSPIMDPFFPQPTHNGNFKSRSPWGWPKLAPFPTHFPPSQFPHSLPFPIYPFLPTPHPEWQFSNQNCAGPFSIGLFPKFPIFPISRKNH
ncbi:uncharacterized protein Gasu_39120 [Galdieria sulphuraria]|uniref:Uncharacterized protein n=1 Tax=Galdieria sulphuraria TaxID=130081 RepID=M2XY21_GALSU|nr:uncharacterized protein Gasu_39120 [Galdieria sulphuraria]EME28533.1 hypothetical protein Gasu_39120 [Galdieria sulphuraria]|eukprot:XP_005705053.1 hypothetical protein Gasu_39120 [Galdieria sulphuraria]